MEFNYILFQIVEYRHLDIFGVIFFINNLER